MEESSSSSIESREALAFRVPDASTEDKSVPEDDDFYDLTLQEFKLLYKEVQRQKDINDRLLPRDKRQEEENKGRPKPKQYLNTVIRIEFPDQTVLQGKFKADETISEVKEFVREHVKEPGAGFDLFTSPPKTVLPDEVKLIDLKLVPTAKLYIVMENGSKGQFLSDRTTLVPFDCAQKAANEIRRPVPEPAVPSSSVPTSKAIVGPSSSSLDDRSKKVPKWFKTNK